MCQFGVLMEINDSALVESAVTNSEEITGISFLEDGGERFVCMMLLCCDLCWRRGIWLGVTRGKWRIWFSHSDLQCGKFCRKSSENGSENQSFNWIASSKTESGHLTVKDNKCNHRDQLISNKNIFTKVKIFAHVWKIFYPPCHLRASHWAAWWRGRGLGQGRWWRGGEAGARPRQCGHWNPSPACKPTPDIFQHSFDIFKKKTFEVEIRFPWKWNKMNSLCFAGLRLIMFS